MVTAPKQQEKKMIKLITQAELQHLSATELRVVYDRVLGDLRRDDLSIEERSLLMQSLRHVEAVLYRRKPHGPNF